MKRPFAASVVHVAALLVTFSVAYSSFAQTPAPSAEDVRALLKRIEELEAKVKALEGTQKPPAGDTAKDERIEQLDQQIKILERNRELEQERAAEKAKSTPRISIGEQGFSFTSADTNFAVQLKGLLQVDSRTFFGDSGIAGNDTIALRRARPMLQGTVFRDFDFLFTPDFATTAQIVDAYLNYKYSPALQLRAGKFKVPIGLELLQSDKDTFFSERALPTDLVPSRDLGFQLHGNLFGGVFGYAAGLFNGVGDGRSSSNVDFDDNKSFAGRVFAHPFKKSSVEALQGLGLGVGSSYEDLQGANTAGLPNGGGYATPAMEQFFAYRAGVQATGNHWRLSPQGYYYNGPFGLLGEYVMSPQDVLLGGETARLHNSGWQVAGGWVITGEKYSYTGLVPKRYFNPGAGGWGAFQVVLRYSQLDVDDDAFPVFADPAASARTAQEWAIGLNWYLNRNIRINGSFSHIKFTGGGGPGDNAPAAVTRNDENVLITRIQLAF